jgi:hypothetical protein
MRRVLQLTCLVVAFCICSRAEDVKLREEAVHLLEVANAVSLPGGLPPFEQTVSFRVHEPDGSVKEGSFTRVSAGAAGHRDEITFGQYHSVYVMYADRVSGKRNAQEPPPEIRELRRNLPIQLGRFDQSDVIRAIRESSVLGRPAKCVEFETLTNGTPVANELCTDTERGVLLRWRVGDDYIENTDFFRIANLYEPAHIRRYLRGQLRMEIVQQMKAIDGPVDPNVFSPPSSQWNTVTGCANRRRPVAVFTPQPLPGNNGQQIVDVVVHGYITDKGAVWRPVVDSSPNPGLNSEALQIVSTWRFLPLMCNDKPAMTDADFVLHFQGR